MNMKAGIMPIGTSGGSDHVVMWIPFDAPMNRPIVNCTVSNLDGAFNDSFNVTTRWVQDIGFEVVVRRADAPGAPWGAYVEVHWIAVDV